MTEMMEKAVRSIVDARNIIALTGAGISVESGIPPFRGKGGVWEDIDPVEYASIESLILDPEKVWNVFLKKLMETVVQAQPNRGHQSLVRLEKMKCLSAVITQNIDGLHQKAGSGVVIEFHGSFGTHRCMTCSHSIKTELLDVGETMSLCACGGLYRPDIVFFGEMIPFEVLKRAKTLARNCDLMLVVGTSAMVYPAADIPVLAKENGAFIVEVNPERTHFTEEVSDITLFGESGEILSRLADRVEMELFL